MTDTTIRDYMANKETIQRAMTVLTEALIDNASVFTCTEADALVTLFGTANAKKAGKQFLEAHALADYEGDKHWTPEQ